MMLSVNLTLSHSHNLFRTNKWLPQCRWITWINRWIWFNLKICVKRKKWGRVISECKRTLYLNRKCNSSLNKILLKDSLGQLQVNLALTLRAINRCLRWISNKCNRIFLYNHKTLFSLNNRDSNQRISIRRKLIQMSSMLS